MTPDPRDRPAPESPPAGAPVPRPWKPEQVRRHIRRLLAQHSTLRIRFLRSLLITMHSEGIVSLEEIQRQAGEGMDESQLRQPPGSSENGDNVMDDNVPLASRFDEEQRRRVQELTIEYASRHLTAAQIDDVLNITRKRDEAKTLEEIANLSTVSFGLLRQKVHDFCAIPRGQTRLPEHEATSVRVALIKRFISEQLEFVGVAKRYLRIRDFDRIVDRIIGPDEGAGLIGGKAGGMILGAKILKRESRTDPQAPRERIRTPESWYMRSDVMERFVSYNALQEFLDQKYKPIDEVRRESRMILTLFRNADFPPEIVERVRQVLHETGTHPLIVRSSSLLEDRFGTAFAGKYRSIFVTNQGTLNERMEQLLGAIAEVYASTLMPDPISYRQRHNLIDFTENMGVLIQKIVGRRIGPYFLPVYAGVGFSWNPYRRNPRIRPEDGLARIVFGLGTRAVDRTASDFARMIPLGLPNLRPEVKTRDIVGTSQQRCDVINVEQNRFETVSVTEVMRHARGPVPGASRVFSTLEHGFLRPLMGDGVLGQAEDLVVTFDGFAQKKRYAERIRWILKTIERAYGCPVDMEFAHDGEALYLLQCRPQAVRRPQAEVHLPEKVPEERRIFSAQRDIVAAEVRNLAWVVLVDPRDYNQLETQEQRRQVARAVSRLNRHLEGERFTLMGPGRWGSKDARMGVPVGYADLNNTRLLVEIARRQEGYLPDVSYGSHFFQDLVESDIQYLALYPDEPDVVFNESFLHGSPNRLAELLPEFAAQAATVRLIDVSQASGGLLLHVAMDDERQVALGYLAEPR
ncbi:MAG: PEP/pyruvate-binding domain-containing protein [Candidatus Krumholzibacteriia bacterium]